MGKKKTDTVDAAIALLVKQGLAVWHGDRLILVKALSQVRALSIDPGGSTGVALWEDKELLDCGAFPYDKVPYWGSFDVIVAEIPQVYPQMPVNPNDLITLSYRLGYVVGKQKTGTLHLVKPRDWKAQLSKAVCHSRSWMRMTPKEQELVGRKGKGLGAKALTDMLDAVAIGQWAIIMGHFK